MALAAGFGVWWFMLRDSGTQSAQTQSTSQQSGKTKSGDSKAAKDDKHCTAAPDAELSSVDHSDTNLVAQLQLTSNCASTKDGDTAEFKESDVKVSIKDDDGNVIASAVFDFSKQPVKFNGETANVALEFTTRQYWRPYDRSRPAAPRSSCRPVRAAPARRAVRTATRWRAPTSTARTPSGTRSLR